MDRRSFLTLLGAGVAGSFLSSVNCSELSEEILDARLLVPSVPHGVLINRRVLGACGMRPPFNGMEGQIQKMFGAGTSLRLWAQLDDAWWDALTPLLKSVGSVQTLAFPLISVCAEKVRFTSPAENNLLPSQQPSKHVEYVQAVLAQMKRVGYSPEGPLCWEVWNEPQFKQNGAWDPAQLGSYANAVALCLREKGLPVKVGVPLHMNVNQTEWNDRLCAALRPDLIDFLVTHYYGFGWHKISRPLDDFRRRCGYAPVLRERVRRNMALIGKWGQGKWTLHCSEWNLHPPSYDPPYYVSRDMAAALHAFSSLRVFIEEGLSSAQFFMVNNAKNFGALQPDQQGFSINMTGALLALVNPFLRGRLLTSEIYSDSYVRDGENDLGAFSIPYLDAMVVEATPSARTVMLANRSPTQRMRVVLQGLSTDGDQSREAWQLRQRSSRQESGVIEKIDVRLEQNALILPPASVTVFGV